MAPLSTRHRLTCTPSWEQLPFNVSFNWLQLSPGCELYKSRHGNGLPWELCIKHTVQQSHRGTLQLIQYLRCMGCPLWTPIVEATSSNHTVLTGWGHNNKSTVRRRFLSFFELLLETLWGIETSELMSWSPLVFIELTVMSLIMSCSGLFSTLGSYCCYVISRKSIRESISKRKCPWQHRDLWLVGSSQARIVIGKWDWCNYLLMKSLFLINCCIIHVCQADVCVDQYHLW